MLIEALPHAHPPQFRTQDGFSARKCTKSMLALEPVSYRNRTSSLKPVSVAVYFSPVVVAVTALPTVDAELSASSLFLVSTTQVRVRP